MNPISRVNTADRLSAVISSTTVTSGCRSDESNPNASPDASQSAAPTSPASQFLQMSVDDAVAPIALYPDQLLAQILTASTNPQQVLDGGNWPLQNQSLKGMRLPMPLWPPASASAHRHSRRVILRPARR